MSKQRKKYCISFVSGDGSIKHCFFSATSKKEANEKYIKIGKEIATYQKEMQAYRNLAKLGIEDLNK